MCSPNSLLNATRYLLSVESKRSYLGNLSEHFKVTLSGKKRREDFIRIKEDTWNTSLPVGERH